jgi:hypothetical protein
MSEKKFKIQPHDPKTLIWWFKQKPKIDVNPPYQRKGRLWSPADKAYLIDSILNGYDVPKLYMADFTWGNSRLNKARLPYAIIDGKQRLEAIFDFFENALTLNPDFKYLPIPHLTLGGLSYKDLRANYPDVADEFDNSTLTIMSVFAEEESPIHELFVRLNRSKPLTGAEVRNAMQGPVTHVVRKIADHSFFQENVRFKIQRGEDYNSAAKFLLFEFEGGLEDTKKATLDAFARRPMTRADRIKLELAGRKVIECLDAMSEIFLPRDSLLSSSGSLPVYYWLIRCEKPTGYHLIREFLVYFEGKRSTVRQLSKDGEPVSQADSVFVRYDNLNRSTNDIGSHKGRHDILQKTFTTWKNAPLLQKMQS